MKLMLHLRLSRRKLRKEALRRFRQTGLPSQTKKCFLTIKVGRRTSHVDRQKEMCLAGAYGVCIDCY
jgi:hypothetical protein